MRNEHYFCGICADVKETGCAIVDAKGTVLAALTMETGRCTAEAAEKIVMAALELTRLDAVVEIVTCGEKRENVYFAYRTLEADGGDTRTRAINAAKASAASSCCHLCQGDLSCAV